MEIKMRIKVGDRLPSGTLSEFLEKEQPGCVIGPNVFKVEDMVKGKTIAIFGVPGAFTPGCSAQHLPGFVKNFSQLKGKGVNEIWCISVNDAFVMGAWARDQKAEGKVRLFGDGSAEYTKKLGLEFDLTGKGLGVRSQRYSMLVVMASLKNSTSKKAAKSQTAPPKIYSAKFNEQTTH
jgi:peroxiredoxin